MACDCGENYQVEFKTASTFKLFLSEHSAATPLSWMTNQKLFVCVKCGNFASRVPDDVLRDLRANAGELG